MRTDKDVVMIDVQYKKYSKTTKKIGNIGKKLACAGLLAGGVDYVAQDVLSNNMRAFIGIGAGASFIAGVILISVAQARCQKVIDEVSESKKTVSGIQQNTKVRG